MARQCKVCSSRYKNEINKLLVMMAETGDNFKSISKRYENITTDMVKHHYYNHVQDKNQSSAANEEPLTLETMQNQVQDLYLKSMKIGDIQNALKAASLVIDVHSMVKKERAEAEMDALKNKPIKLVWATSDNEMYQPLPKPAAAEPPGEFVEEADCVRRIEQPLLVEPLATGSEYMQHKPVSMCDTVVKHVTTTLVDEDGNEYEEQDGVRYTKIKNGAKGPDCTVSDSYTDGQWSILEGAI